MSIQGRVLLVLTLMLGPICVFAATNMITITQRGRAFSSSTIDIARGESVRFSNIDKFIHQIYVESSSFNYESDEQPPDSSVNIAFPAAGTFEVRCHIHPKMLLNVNVR